MKCLISPPFFLGINQLLEFYEVMLQNTELRLDEYILVLLHYGSRYLLDSNQTDIQVRALKLMNGCGSYNITSSKEIMLDSVASIPKIRNEEMLCETFKLMTFLNRTIGVHFSHGKHDALVEGLFGGFQIESDRLLTEFMKFLN